jgi:integrase
LRRAMLSAAWRDACETIGAPPELLIHELRHYAATMTARMPGVTTKELMARIGHAPPRPAPIYQHATAERVAEIAAWWGTQIEEAANEPRPIRARFSTTQNSVSTTESLT